MSCDPMMPPAQAPEQELPDGTVILAIDPDGQGQLVVARNLQDKPIYVAHALVRCAAALLQPTAEKELPPSRIARPTGRTPFFRGLGR